MKFTSYLTRYAALCQATVISQLCYDTMLEVNCVDIDGLPCEYPAQDT